MNRDSSVGIVTLQRHGRYGVRFSADARDYSLLQIVQTSSRGQPAPSAVGTGVQVHEVNH
jgi:hypothetical protein